MQDVDNAQAGSGIATLDELTTQVAEKGALANVEVIAPQVVDNSGLPAADSCQVAALTLPLAVARAGESAESPLVSADSGIAVFKINSVAPQ